LISKNLRPSAVSALTGSSSSAESQILRFLGGESQEKIQWKIAERKMARKS